VETISPDACEDLARNGLGTETLRLYCAAYQALLWNRMASTRLKLARHVLPGDAVLRYGQLGPNSV
jgi:tRNA(Glu) U13 pseudouridine synthase TruD